jgi:hypothetical protein
VLLDALSPRLTFVISLNSLSGPFKSRTTQITGIRVVRFPEFWLAWEMVLSAIRDYNYSLYFSGPGRVRLPFTIIGRVDQVHRYRASAFPPPVGPPPQS